MSFKSLEQVLNPYLDLPILGTTYRIGAVDAHTGLRMTALVDVALAAAAGTEVGEADMAALQLDDDAERDFTRSLLPGYDPETGRSVPGGAYEKMLADGVPWVYISHCARTCFSWAVQGREEAEKYWNSGGSDSPKARAKSPTDRKAKKSPKGNSPSGSTSRKAAPAG